MSYLSDFVKELKNCAAEYKNNYHSNDPVANLIDRAAHTIEIQAEKLQRANAERSSAHYHNGWISCKDSLPNPTEIVLCNIPPDGEYCDRVAFGYIAPANLGYWCKSDWLGTVGRYGKMKPQPTAWMPLPEPFKENEVQDADRD